MKATQNIGYETTQNIGHEATQNIGYEATQNIGYEATQNIAKNVFNYVLPYFLAIFKNSGENAKS